MNNHESGSPALSDATATGSDHAPWWAMEWVTHCVTVIALLLLLDVIVTIVYLSVTVDVTKVAAEIAQYTFTLEQVAPEPAEQTAYLLALLAMPFCIIAALPLAHSWASRLTGTDLRAYFLGSCSTVLMLVAFAALGDGFFYWQGAFVLVAPGLFFLLIILAAELWLAAPGLALPKSILQPLFLTRDIALSAVAVAFVAVSGLLRVFPATDAYVTDNHFEAVFFASVRVAQGKTLLVDGPHQYGLYPEFLAPVFRALGGITVFRFSVVMALLQCTVLCVWLATLLRVMQARWLAILTFLGLFAFTQFFVPRFIIEMGVLPYYDPYFQYSPIRTVFPAIAFAGIAFTARKQRYMLRSVRLIGSAVLGAGVLWNVDAGVPAFGAWLLFLCHLKIQQLRTEEGSLFQKAVRFAALPLEAIGAAFLAVVSCLVLLAAKAGQYPDLSMILSFQKQFYGVGFYMLPMRLMHSWLVLALIVLGAMSYGLASLVPSLQPKNAIDPLRSTVFGWAILACGLFSYYQGRSHDWVFPVVTPLGFVFVALAVDQLFVPTSRLPGIHVLWMRSSAYIAIAFAALMASGTAGACTQGRVFMKSIIERTLRNAAQNEAPHPIGPALTFLKTKLTPGQSALILSNHAGVYHAETSTHSELRQGLMELFVRAERDELLRQIQAAPVVFVDQSVLGIQRPNSNPETNLLITETLAKHFDKVAGSPGNYLLEFKNKNIAAAGSRE